MSAQAIAILTTRLLSTGLLSAYKGGGAALGSAYAIGLVGLADFASAFLWMRVSKASPA
jgi:hypothetical protein